MKTLVVFSGTQHFQRLEQQAREAADTCPRSSLFDKTLNADVVDDTYLKSSQPSRFLLKFPFIPLPLIQALAVHHRRNHYDAIVGWDDRFALIYAFLLMFSRSRSRFVTLISWMAPPKKAFALKFVQKRIDRIITWTQNHKELLVEFSGISPARIAAIPYFVDHRFWHPLDGVNENMICSAGNSRRDYATLIEAVRDLDVTCRIVTTISHTQKSDPDYNATGSSLAEVSHLPDNVVLGPASPVELRTIYDHSRFVVVPLYPSFRDSGITVIVEAMAMGKAVICSRIYGLVDLVDDGVNGIFVPPGDPQALRTAILYLTENPEVAAQMGAEGRKRAEKIFALDLFVANVHKIVDEVIAGHQH
jgi:glycosyltransferase involved in cell wall biosynthesis